MEQAVSQETINECVIAAHGNLTKLRDLVEKYPSRCALGPRGTRRLLKPPLTPRARKS